MIGVIKQKHLAQVFNCLVHLLKKSLTTSWDSTDNRANMGRFCNVKEQRQLSWRGDDCDKVDSGGHLTFKGHIWSSNGSNDTFRGKGGLWTCRQIAGLIKRCACEFPACIIIINSRCGVRVAGSEAVEKGATALLRFQSPDNLTCSHLDVALLTSDGLEIRKVSQFKLHKISPGDFDCKHKVQTVFFLFLLSQMCLGAQRLYGKTFFYRYANKICFKGPIWWWFRSVLFILDSSEVSHN